MNDTVLRHIISLVATIIGLLIFFAGYIAGGYGWWWVALGLIVVYGAVYRVVDAGGGHH